MGLRSLLMLASGLALGLHASVAAAQGPMMISALDRLFLALDANHDGVLSRDEARASPLLREYFDDADSNADDVIDRAEFAIFETNSGTGGGYGSAGSSGSSPGYGVPPGPNTGVSGAPAGAPGVAGTPPPTSSNSTAAPGVAAPAGTPPPTSSGPSGSGTVAGTPPPPSSSGQLAVPGATTGGTTGSAPSGAGGGIVGGPPRGGIRR